MFGMNWGRKKEADHDWQHLTARLNARVQPIDRGEYYEDPLQETLEKAELGEVTGGGTQLADEPAGIEFCDLEIRVKAVSNDVLDTIVGRLEELGAPKGSRLMLDGSEQTLPFGVNEGLGLFVNGTDLPEEVYANSDINHVIEECDRLIGVAGDYRGYWEGSQETALYFYGNSYEQMKAAIQPFIASYPLCQEARIEQIA